MTATPWDDDRLDAAFASVATQHPTPVDLVAPTWSAIARRPRYRFAWSGLVGAAAIVAVVVAVVGGLSLGYQGVRQTADPSPSATTPAAAPGSSTAAPTTSGLGSPTMTVGDAIAVRDAGIDDREIAVGGWYVERGALPCPLFVTVSPLQLHCPEMFQWLMQEPESLFTRTGSGETMRQPSGPALNPALDGLEGSWVPTRLGSSPTPIPIEIVMVGHFDDAGAAACPPTEVQACRDRFVVDEVRSVDGTALASKPPLPSATSAPADAPLGLHVRHRLRGDRGGRCGRRRPGDRRPWLVHRRPNSGLHGPSTASS